MNKEKLFILKRHTIGILCLIPTLLLACTMSYSIGTSTPAEVATSPTIPVLPTVTLLPTWTPPPIPTSAPMALDFIALLCSADWMNGSAHLTPCPANGADQSGGYAAVYTSVPEDYPTDAPILLMIPNANALFLRYPSYKVGTGDRFRTTLLCATSAPCDVEFALEYYDAQGKYHEFLEWRYKTGDPPIEVDAELRLLAGQSVDFVLVLRLFHEIESPQHDNGLWVAPHIYRPDQ